MFTKLHDSKCVYQTFEQNRKSASLKRLTWMNMQALPMQEMPAKNSSSNFDCLVQFGEHTVAHVSDKMSLIM